MSQVVDFPIEKYPSPLQINFATFSQVTGRSEDIVLNVYYVFIFSICIAIHKYVIDKSLVISPTGQCL